MITRAPSALKEAEETELSCFSETNISGWRRRSHTRAVWSLDAVTICDPSGLNVAELTKSCSSKGTKLGRLLDKFHNRAVPTCPSSASVRICVPSALKDTEMSIPLCPFSDTKVGCSPRKSHTRAVRSSEPVTRRVLSALNDADVTAP